MVWLLLGWVYLILGPVSRDNQPGREIMSGLLHFLIASFDAFPTLFDYKSICIHLPCVNFVVKKFLNVAILEKIYLKKNIPVHMSPFSPRINNIDILDSISSTCKIYLMIIRNITILKEILKMILLNLLFLAEIQ